jgi:arylsulfatase A-like enzyme
MAALSADREKPNVLFIAIDDMNDWVGCLGGHPDSLTPHLDRLAGRGTLFTNAHCQAPICNPSRSSVMYGLRPSTSGIYANGPLPWKVPALDRYSTLPRWFARHGYDTACVGKVYHSSKLPDGDFDLVGPRPGQRLADLDEQLRTDLPKGVAGLWDFGPQSYDERLFQDHADATWAIDQLGRDPGKPFFLAVGFYRPHVPFYAPQRIFDDLPVDEVDLPKVKADDWDDIPGIAREVTFNKAPPPHSWFVENGAWREAVQAYLACIRWTDEQIGRLLDALDASPHAENTIVALYSDHGFHLGEKDRWTKFSLWERSTRVPLILCAPGFPAGQRCDHPAELLSLYPTLLELCGLPANSHLEGRSLVPLLRDASADWPHHALTTHGRDNHAVRSHRWRYLRYHDGSEELYDMQADPDEWDNLAADGFSEEEAAVVARLSEPAATHDNKRVLFTTCDVTRSLRSGSRNVLGLMLGNGWYNQENYGLLEFDLATWRDKPKAWLQLRIEYEDGKTAWVVSDSRWRAARSPIVFDAIRNGELYDACLEQPGWDEPEFDDSAWSPVRLAAEPEGKLVPMNMPPERVVEVPTNELIFIQVRVIQTAPCTDNPKTS